MAAHPIIVVDDALLEKLPTSFRSDPRYTKGASLELVPVTDEHSAQLDEAAGDWRKLEGILAIEDKCFSATRWKHEERDRELAHDERKFGRERPRW